MSRILKTSTDRTELYYEVYGAGSTIVLIHGFLSSSQYWRKTIEQLSASHKVIAIDLLGFGNSPKPYSSKYDYRAHIDSIDATLNTAGVNGKFKLVGHSMGALLALRYAIEKEHRVSKLVLVNMPVHLSENEARKTYLAVSLLHRLALTRIVHIPIWQSVKLLFKTKLISSENKAKLAGNEYFFMHNRASRFRSFQNVIVKAQTEIDLARINVSTSILTGASDRVEYLHNLKSKIVLRSNIIHNVLDTGHHIPCMFPKALADVVSE